MGRARKQIRGVDPDIVYAVRQLVREVIGTPHQKKKPVKEYSLDEKLSVLDRALKLEAIVLKVKDDDEGAFFNGLNNGDEKEDNETDKEGVEDE